MKRLVISDERAVSRQCFAIFLAYWVLLNVVTQTFAQSKNLRKYKDAVQGFPVIAEIQLLKQQDTVFAVVLALRNTSESSEVIIRTFNSRTDSIFPNIQIFTNEWKEISPKLRSASFHEWRTFTDVRVPKSQVREWFLPLAELVDNKEGFEGERLGRLDISVFLQIAIVNGTKVGAFKLASLRFYDYDIKLSGEDLRRADIQAPSSDMLRFTSKPVIETNVVRQLRQTVDPATLQFAEQGLPNKLAPEVAKRLAKSPIF